MRKIHFLKTVLSVAAAISLSVGVFGQIPADYHEFNSDESNGAAHHDSIDYVSIGSTLGYYATPDPIYHPNFSATGTPAWSLTAGFTWDWTVPAGVSIDATPALPSPPANYVELVYANTGLFDISVSETAPAAMGGCAGIPTYLYVNVIPLPTATLRIVPGDLVPAIAPTTWQENTAGVAYQICGSQVAQTVTMNFVEAVPLYYASYSFQVTREIDRIDGSGNVVAVAGADGAETVIDNFPLGAGTQLSNAHEGVLTNASFVETGAGNFTFTFSSDALDVLSLVATPTVNYRTRYTYRVRTADNAAPFTDVSATNTFVSNILAKSDYLALPAAKRSINFTNAAITFIVNPAPVTGPIYHVPNNYSF